MILKFLLPAVQGVLDLKLKYSKNFQTDDLWRSLIDAVMVKDV